jgi:hypothetical protein
VSQIALALLCVISFSVQAAGPSLDDLMSEKRCTEVHDKPNAYDCMVDGADGSVKKTRIFKWIKPKKVSAAHTAMECQSTADCASLGDNYECLARKYACGEAATCGGKVCDLPELADHPEWAQCDSDSDCVNISYSCAGGTVNKKFADKAQRIFNMQNARRDCAAETSPRSQLPFKVFCKEKKCGSQGRNPKIGLN